MQQPTSRPTMQAELEVEAPMAAPLADRKRSSNQAPRVSNQGPSLSLTSKVDYETSPAGVDTERFALASLTASESATETTRNPIDVVIVLDKSGSMTGEKLELCKRTMDFLVNNGLTENDYLSLVTFDSNVTVNYPGGMMTKENKAIVLERVAAIHDGSATNLSDGLFTGLNILRKASTAEVSAVCILTDGMMNGGITDRAQLTAMTKQMINNFPEGKAKPSVFTFGYGSDADHTMMKTLSDDNGGSFYSILNPEAVPLSFADCLGGLTSVAAQNVELTCEVIGTNATLKGAPLTKFPSEMISNTKCVIKIKDMYCGEHRDTVFRVALAKGKPEPVTIKFTCKFTDTLNESFQSIENSSVVVRYDGDAPPSGPRSLEVARHIIRLQAVEAMDKARIYGETGDYATSQETVKKTILETEATIAALGEAAKNDLMLSEVLSDLRLASTKVKDAQTFRTEGAQMMSSAAQSHAYQRSNKVDSMMEERSEDHSAYMNASKKVMMKSAKANFGY